MNGRYERILRTLLYLTAVVLLNAAAVTLFFRFDLTRNKIYTLSEASRNVVATLQEPLTIKAFFSKNMPAPYNNIEQQVRDLLDEYARWGNEFFNYSFHSMGTGGGFDPNTLDENETLARSYRIFPIQLEQVEKDEVTLVNAYMGLAFLYGDHLETIPAVTQADRLEYNVTQAIVNLNQRIDALLSLEEGIRIDLILSSSLLAYSDALADIPARLDDAVHRLNKNFLNRLSYRHIDPDKVPDAVSEAARFRIPPVFIGEDEGGTANYAYAGLAIHHGTDAFAKAIIQTSYEGLQVADLESLEILIESSVNAILGVHEEVGFLADFGTPPYRGIAQQSELSKTDLSVFYPLVSLDYRIKGLLLEDREIPQAMKCLLIVSPNEELNDWALFQIDQFLMGGGSVVMFLDAFNMLTPRDPTTNEPTGQSLFFPRMTGLEALIKHFGIELAQAYVLDEESYVYRERNTAGGIDEVPIYTIPIIGRESLNQELTFLSNIDGLIAINASPLVLLKEESDDLRIFRAISSSDRAWQMSNEPLRASGTFGATPPLFGKKSYPIAYLLEGTFRSFFADRPIPARPRDDAESDGDTAVVSGPEVGDFISGEREFLPEGEGKLFVMGTSTVLGSNVLDPDGNGPNALFLLNILDYMNNREERAGMRGKGRRFAPIEDTTPGRRTFTKTFNIAAIPALVAVAGGFMWLYRLGKKRRIARRFPERSRGVAKAGKKPRSGRGTA